MCGVVLGRNVIRYASYLFLPFARAGLGDWVVQEQVARVPLCAPTSLDGREVDRSRALVYLGREGSGVSVDYRLPRRRRTGKSERVP